MSLTYIYDTCRRLRESCLPHVRGTHSDRCAVCTGTCIKGATELSQSPIENKPSEVLRTGEKNMISRCVFFFFFFSSVLFVWLVGCVFVVVVLFIVMRLKIPLICYRFCKFSAPVMRFSSDAFSPTSRFALFPGFCFDVTKVFFDITDRSPKALRRNACGSFLPRIIYYYYFKQFFKDFLIL